MAYCAIPHLVFYILFLSQGDKLWFQNYHFAPLQDLLFDKLLFHQHNKNELIKKEFIKQEILKGCKIIILHPYRISCKNSFFINIIKMIKIIESWILY